LKLLLPKYCHAPSVIAPRAMLVGTLQATTIDLRPARDGKCGGEGRPHGHGG